MIKNITAITVGTCSGLGTYFYQKINEKNRVVETSWTNSEKPVNECSKWNENWDFRCVKSIIKPLKNSATPSEENAYNEKIEKLKPKAVRHIYLVRHGEYLDETDDDANHHLTETGRMQATSTGKRLKDLGIKFDRVIASTMTRAQETMNLIVKEVEFDKCKVEHCNYIREGAPAIPEPPVGHWKPEAHQFFRDGARIEAGFRKYFHRADSAQKEDTHTLIVGHGNVIRYFFCRALQFPPEAWLRINVNHASITKLTIYPSGRITVRTLGEAGHLPKHLLTYRIPRPEKNVV